jgi:hypothetical protein
MQPSRIHIGLYQSIETGLVNRHDVGIQPLDFARIFIDADNIMAEIGKACPRNKANIARADHRNFHRLTSIMVGFSIRALMSKPIDDKISAGNSLNFERR